MRLWPARTSACTVHQDTQPCRGPLALQPFASAWPCRHNPFRRFQNRRSTFHQDTKPCRGPLALCQRLATSPQSIALQPQPFASAWPCRHSPFKRFQNRRSTFHQDTKPCRGPLKRFANAIPGHRKGPQLQQREIDLSPSYQKLANYSKSAP